MVDLSPHIAQINALRLDRSEPYSDPQLDFISFLREQGYKPPDRLRLGPPFMKFPCAADTGNKKKGFCIYHEIPDDGHAGRVIGIGIYGNYYDGLEPKKWVSRNFQGLSASQRADLAERIEEQSRQYEIEKEKSYREAATIARQIYEQGDGSHPMIHPYLEKKKIKAVGAVRIATTSLENEKPGDLIVPIINDKNELMSLEFIQPGGFKMHMAGGKKLGCFFFIAGKHDKIVYICEGYSTAATVHEATGRTVYVCFGSSNLFNVASYVKNAYPQARVIIAGDDDVGKPRNTGREAAEAAAQALGIECIFPTLQKGVGKDWNDLACSESMAAVKRQLDYQPEAYKKESSDDFELEPPPGMLRDVYNYFNMTAGQDQRGFAVQVALAVTSIFTARNFRTTPHGNLTSLYLLCIGKSSTGKEHARKTIQNILSKTNHNELLGNSGYTSAAAVLTDLTEKPRHINIIDEFGRNLETARKSGDALLAGANTKLMEAFGQLDGQMSPMGYAALNLSKEKRKEMQNRRIYCPAITLFAMTVPTRFYNALDVESIQDGFLGRFLIFDTDAKRSIWMPKQKPEFPEAIRDWVRRLYSRIGEKPEFSSIEPDEISLTVSVGAERIRIKYATECNDIADELERFGLAELSGKAAEIMMRVALIAALARDPMADMVTEEDAKWAYRYVKHCFDKTFKAVKQSVSGSPFESKKKEALIYFRELGDIGLTEAQMQKTKPFSSWLPRELKDVIEALVKAELVATKQEQRGKKMSLVYYAVV